MNHEEAVAELDQWWKESKMADLFRGGTRWEVFTKLRSHLCETCNHAFEHHGTRMSGGSLCWVAECNCREAK